MIPNLDKYLMDELYTGENSINYEGIRIKEITSLYGISLIPDKMRDIKKCILSGFLDAVHDPDFPKKPFAHFNQLEELRLECRELETLPPDIFDEAHTISRLEIFRCKDISERNYTQFYENLSYEYSWDSLQEICLEYGETNLSLNIFKPLTQLEHLRISCGLSNIEKDMFKHMEALKYLDLSYNSFSILPESLFDSVRELQELYLQRNVFLEKVPENLLHNNKQLKIIDLSETDLKFLPKDFFKGLTCLVEIKLHHRKNLQQVRIGYLPTTIFADCVLLEYLYINGLSLMFFPRGYFNTFLHLKALYIDGCERPYSPTEPFDIQIDKFFIKRRESPIASSGFPCFAIKLMLKRNAFMSFKSFAFFFIILYSR